MGRGEEDGIVGERRQGPGERSPGGGSANVAGPAGPDGASRGGWRMWAVVFWVFVIPLLLHAAMPVPPGRKAALPAALVLGREGVRRYLDPRAWSGRSRKS